MSKSMQASRLSMASRRFARRVAMPALSDFLKNESGTTAIEYGLMAAGISAVVLAAVSTTSTNLKATLDGISIKFGPP